ncbi:MAG: hypothetical protein KIT09_13225 [Bryobacteraceae bacterium]|nr:hypothetical protein [Bryobacteraceae bacterium]
MSRAEPVARAGGIRSFGPSPRRARRESGFAMLLVFFMAAAVAIMLYKEMPRLMFETQRVAEQDLIFRGEQYQRAIQLYVRKNKRYPQSLDDLEKGSNMRFLRRKYKDPLTGKDEWRLIHIDNAGFYTDSLIHKPKQEEEKKSQNTFISEGAAFGSTGPPPGQEGQGGGHMFRGASDRPAARAGEFEGTPGGFPPISPDQPHDQQEQFQQQQFQQQQLQQQQFEQQQQFQPQELPSYESPQENETQPGVNPDQGFVQDPNQQLPQEMPPQPVQPGQPSPYPYPVQSSYPTGAYLPGQQPYPGHPPGQPQYPVQQPYPGQMGGYPQQPNPYAPLGLAPGAIPGAGPGMPRMPMQLQPRGPQGMVGVAPYVQPQPPYGQQPSGPQTPPMPVNPGGPGMAGGPGMPGFPGTPGIPGGPANPALAAIQAQLTTPRPGGLAGLQAGNAGGMAGIPGGIAGVASKMEAGGIIVYNERTKYHEWEFLYDMKKEQEKAANAAAGAMGAGGQQGNPLGGQPQSGAGTPQGGGFSFGGNPSQPQPGPGRGPMR